MAHLELHTCQLQKKQAKTMQSNAKVWEGHDQRCSAGLSHAFRLPASSPPALSASGIVEPCTPLAAGPLVVFPRETFGASHWRRCAPGKHRMAFAIASPGALTISRCLQCHACSRCSRTANNGLYQHLQHLQNLHRQCLSNTSKTSNTLNTLRCL